VNVSPCLWACLVAGSLAAAPVHSQPAPPDPGPATAGLTLRAALDAAWQRAVAARQSEGLRRQADVERAAINRFWAAPPALELSHRNDRLHRSSGQRETEIGVAVPLWLPGQRAARAGTADAAAAQALAAEQRARWHLAGELREAAGHVAALQAEAQQAEAEAGAAEQLASDVERRVRAGDLARADALAAQAERLAASVQQTDLQQRLQAARARWTLLTGLSALPVDALAPVPFAVPSAAAEQGESAHPEMQLALRSTELARQRVALLRHSRREAPELSIGVRQDVPGRAEAAQGSLGVSLRLPLGTADRNRPLEAAALAELDGALSHEQALHERLASERATAGQALRSAELQLGAESARAGLLRERARLIEQSFRAGETPLPDLLRARAAAAQADSAVARQTAALGLARARLHQTLGLLP
jgi:outer membrane protein TolC